MLQFPLNYAKRQVCISYEFAKMVEFQFTFFITYHNNKGISLTWPLYLNVRLSSSMQLQVAPYPDTGDLQTSLDNHVEWTAYKQQVVRDSCN